MRRLLSATGLLALAAIGLATAWAVPFTAGSLVQVSGASPFASCTADNAAGQPGTVFPDSEVEPFIAANPITPLNVVGIWQQDRWSNGGARGNVAGTSFDGGETWLSVPLPGVTKCTGGEFDRASDPWVTFAPNGDLYAMSLVLDIEAPPGKPGGFGRNGMMVSKSTDGGLTWSTPILIAENTRGDLHDKNSITADPTDPNVVYAVWDFLDLPEGATINPDRGIFGGGLGFKGAALISRTTDRGLTWEAPRVLYNPGGVNQTIGNQIVVTPDGTVINLFNEILNFRNDDGGSQFDFNLSLKRSTDKGVTWMPRGRPIRAAKMFPRGVRDPETGDPVRTGDVIPDVAVDPLSGALYAVWMDARFSGGQHDSIAFAQSLDGGFAWSGPIKVNATPTGIPSGNQQAFTPSVHVAADGTVAVTYYDFRNNDAAADLKTDYFVVHCHPLTATACAAAANWGNEKRLTDTSFDMRQAPFAVGFFVGDYEGLASDGPDFLAFFSQPHGFDPSSVFFRRVGP